MNTLRILPAPRIEGELAVPGDKSISHRAIIFASLATGTTRISGFLPGEDCLRTLRAFQALGVHIEQIESDKLHIEGANRQLRPAMEAIDCGNSGTTMRLLAGVLAGQSFSSRLLGDASLTRRPMRRILEPLGLMGARITAEGPEGTAPLLIEGSTLAGITYQTPVASAQVKSCLLLAGLLGTGTTTVTEPHPSRDHTERMFTHFHLPLRRTDEGVTIRGGGELHAEDLRVPGDFSSAAFWLAAASAMPGSNLIIRNVGLNSTRTGLLNILVRMGAQIRESIETSAAEPFGALHVTGHLLQGTEIKGAEIANVIDEIPVIAAVAALAKGTTTIRDAAELRVKESDRITIMAKNLRSFGVTVEELPDGLVIQGGEPIQAAIVSSHGDHRIAMACAILALSANGPSRIADVDCIHTSYPGFADHLKFLTESSAPRWTTRLWRRLLPPRVKAAPSAPAPELNVVIAIDGPAASGKSSVSRTLAARLGYDYLNTGALYRGITWSLLQQKIDLNDAEAVHQWMQSQRLECRFEEGQLIMRVNGDDPLPFIREAVVNQHVSIVAAHPEVRRALLPLQQSLAGRGPLVVEGRDISSHVFPHTPHKFYLDADPDVREARRAGQGENDSVRKRDQLDSTRSAAPLTLVDGAVKIDTSDLNLEEVVDAILGELKKQGLNFPA